MTSYPPSTLAYALLNKLLDSLLPFPVSSTSSTFTLPTVDTTSSSSTKRPIVASVTSLVSSTSAVPLPPISSLLNTTASTTPPVSSSSNSSPIPITTPSLFLHQQDAVATSPNLQQYSAVRQLTSDLQKKKPRHPKRPQQPPDGIGKLVRRLVHTVVYKQKLTQYIDALKKYEKHLDELIQQTTFELDKLSNNPLPPSKVRKFKPPQPQFKQLSPLSIQIPSHNHNSYNHHNCFHYNSSNCSHVPFTYAINSQFPPLLPSPALIPIRIEPITPPCAPPSPLNDLDMLVSSLNDVD